MTSKVQLEKRGENAVFVRQQMVVKSIVDENFKVIKKEELEKSLHSAKEGHNQLTQHLQKLQGESSLNARKQVEEHLQRIAGQIAVLQYQLQALNDVKVGDYFTEMVLDGFVSIKKEDNIKAKLGRLEIITKNDIVQEIKSLPFEDKK